MTRLDQALRWWRNNVLQGEWKAGEDIPVRHFRVLNKAGLLAYRQSIVPNFSLWRLK